MKPDEKKTKQELLDELSALRRQASRREHLLERLKMVAELAADLAYINRIEPDGNRTVLFETSAFEKIFGASLQPLVTNETFRRYIAPEFKQECARRFKRTIQGQSNDGEVKLLLPDGRVVWIDLALRPFTDEAGRLTESMGVGLDITARKQALDAMEASEKRYRQVTDLMSDFAFSVSMRPGERRLVDWETESFERIMGCTAAELLNHGGFRALAHEDSLGMVEERRTRLVNGLTHEGQFRLVNKRGEEIWLYMTTRPLAAEDGGRTIAIICAGRDITARKQAEARLAQLEERHRLISEISTDWAYYMRLNPEEPPVVEWESPAFEKHVGYTVREAFENHGGMFPFAHPENRARFEARREELAKGNSVRGEYCFKNATGQWVWVESNIRPLLDPATGRVKALVGAGRDITARKQAEAKLAQLEERHRLISEISTDWAYYMRLNPEEPPVVEWESPAFRKQLGYTVQEIYAMGGLVTLAHPESVEEFSRRRNMVRQGQTHTGEFRLRAASGEYLWIEMSTRPVTPPGAGEPLALIAAGRDITERKQAEAKLAQLEERYRLVTEMSTDWAYYIRLREDGPPVVEWETPAFIKQFGYSVAEAIKAGGFVNLAHPNSRPDLETRRQTLRQGKQMSGEYQVRTASGEYIWIELNSRPVLSPQGAPLALIAAGRDITAKKEAEEALKTLSERHQFISEMSTDWAYYIQLREEGPPPKVIWETPAFKKRLGYSVAEAAADGGFIGRAHPDSRADFLERKRVMGLGQHCRGEYRMRTASGEYVWLEIYSRPVIPPGQTTPVAIIGAGRDITAKKEAEEALKTLSERHQLISELATDWAYYIKTREEGPPPEVIWETPAFKKRLGYSIAEAIEMGGFISLAHPDSKEDLIERRELLRAGHQCHGEYRMRTASGEYVWVEINSRPIALKGQDEPTVLLGAGRDITARKEAEAALKNMQARYQLISELASDFALSVVYEKGERPQVEWCTESFTRITGYTAQEAFTNRDARIKLADVTRSLSGPQGQRHEHEFQIERRDGSTAWLQTVHIHQPAWREKGWTGRMVIVGRDVTAKKNTEATLARLEERHRVLYELISDFAFSSHGGCTPEARRVVDWETDSLKRVLGYSIEEMRAIGGFPAINHPETRPLAEERKAALLAGKGYQGEFRVLTPDGRDVWVHLYSRPLKDGSDRILGAGQDITARKRAEEELQGMRARYQLISELASDFALSVKRNEDLSLEMEWCTDSFERITGYTEHEIISDLRLPKITLPGSQEMVEARAQAIAQGKQHEGEFQIRRKDGSTAWLYLIHRSEWNKAKQWADRVIVVGRDITAKKEAEAELTRYKEHLENLVSERTEALKKANQSLEREVQARKMAAGELARAHAQLEEKARLLASANEELSQYAYVVSHDLKAPLRAMHNYTDFLIEDLKETVALAPEQERYLEGLAKATGEAETLVEDLLELTQIDRRSMTFVAVDLGLFFRSLVDAIGGGAIFEMAPQWPSLEVEPVLLRQALQNILTNAIKFNTSQTKRVQLTWDDLENGFIQINIADNGIGIDRKFAQKIFRAFERLHTRSEYEGTGIGLAIAKKAISRLGGTIDFESEPGRGTTFHLRLPWRNQGEEIEPETF